MTNLWTRGQILDRIAVLRVKAARGLVAPFSAALYSPREVETLLCLEALHRELFVAEDKAAETLTEMERTWGPWSVLCFALASARVRRLNRRRHLIVGSFDGACAEPKRYGGRAAF